MISVCKGCLVFSSCRFREIITCNKLFYWADERCGGKGYLRLKKWFPNWQLIEMQYIEGKMTDYAERHFIDPSDPGDYSVCKWAEQ
jgi:hypothetical protein